MVDLKSQYKKICGEIDSEIKNVIESSAFIKGPAVKAFEKSLANYLNVENVIGCGNGTDALQLALMALDLNEGDEVITPSFTFIATVEVIKLLGLKPVFIDVNEDNYTLKVDKLESLISPKTKVILPVHLFGQCADMEQIMNIAAKYNLFVIEDNAQAIGAVYSFSDGTSKKSGTIGNIGCTSFFPSKNLGCYGDGGAVFTNDNALAEKIRILANHGMKTRYYHDYIGVNSRLDSIQAAILSVKLKYLDEYNNARLKAADYYDKAFENCEFLSIPKRNNNSSHVFHQYTLVTKDIDREDLKEFLANKGVPMMIYYPVPVHLQKAYKDENSNIELTVTEMLSESVISLPIHSEMGEDQLEYICSSVLEFIDKMSL